MRLFCKKSELDASIAPFLAETRVRVERFILRVLKNKYAILLKQVAIEHHIYHLFATGQVIRRIRKDDIILLGTTFQVQKHIRIDGMDNIRTTQLHRCTANKGVMNTVNLDRGDISRATRSKLLAD